MNVISKRFFSLAAGLAILLAPGTILAQSLPNQLTPTGGGSSLQSEIESILGESEQDIMQGIKDAIINMAIGAVADALGVSPVKSVEKLKDMLKDAHSKLQKINYQQYKVGYEEKRAATTLSNGFVDYYNNLNLKEDLDKLVKVKQGVNKVVQSRLFTASEQSVMSQTLSELAKTDDIVDDVKTACNLSNSGEVWMSDAERANVLDGAKEEISDRLKTLMAVRSQIVNAYAYRVRQLAHNTTLGNLYDKNTTLNRTIGIAPKSY